MGLGHGRGDIRRRVAVTKIFSRAIKRVINLVRLTIEQPGWSIEISRSPRRAFHLVLEYDNPANDLTFLLHSFLLLILPLCRGQLLFWIIVTMLHWIVCPRAVRNIAPIAIELFIIILKSSYLPRVTSLLRVSNVHRCSISAPTYADLWLILEVIIIFCAIRFLLDHLDRLFRLLSLVY